MEIVDVIYCLNDEFTDQLFDYLVKSGYAVTKANAEIDTGTWGKVAAKQLMVMRPELPEAKRMERWWDDKEVEKLNAAGTQTGRFSSEKENKAGTPKGGRK